MPPRSSEEYQLVFVVFVLQLAGIRSIHLGSFRGGLGIRRYHGLRSPEIGCDGSDLLGCVAEFWQEAIDYCLRARNRLTVRFDGLGLGLISSTSLVSCA